MAGRLSRAAQGRAKPRCTRTVSSLQFRSAIRATSWLFVSRIGPPAPADPRSSLLRERGTTAPRVDRRRATGRSIGATTRRRHACRRQETVGNRIAWFFAATRFVPPEREASAFCLVDVDLWSYTGKFAGKSNRVKKRRWNESRLEFIPSGEPKNTADFRTLNGTASDDQRVTSPRVR